MLLNRKLNIVKIFITFKIVPCFKINPFEWDRMILKFIWKNNVARIGKSNKGLTLLNINIY